MNRYYCVIEFGALIGVLGVFVVVVGMIAWTSYLYGKNAQIKRIERVLKYDSRVYNSVGAENEKK